MRCITLWYIQSLNMHLSLKPIYISRSNGMDSINFAGTLPSYSVSYACGFTITSTSEKSKPTGFFTNALIGASVATVHIC